MLIWLTRGSYREACRPKASSVQSGRFRDPAGVTGSGWRDGEAPNESVRECTFSSSNPPPVVSGAASCGSVPCRIRKASAPTVRKTSLQGDAAHQVGHRRGSAIGRAVLRIQSVSMPPPAILPRATAADVAARLRVLRQAGAVRLDATESAAIAAAVDGVRAERIDLFGSRTDPRARGGDVDLLVFTDEPPLAISRQISCRFFARCEERIDVVVLNPDTTDVAQRAFLRSLTRVPLT